MTVLNQPIFEKSSATLIFSCSFNGAVAAIIMPQSTDYSRPIREHYVVAAWRNSIDINKNDIFKIFKLFAEMYLFGSSHISSKKTAKIFAKLEARHLATSEGKNKLISYFSYLSFLIKGLRKIYGLEKP